MCESDILCNRFLAASPTMSARIGLLNLREREKWMEGGSEEERMEKSERGMKNV